MNPIPPQSIDAEQAVLGSLIIDDKGDCRPEVLGLLEPTDFCRGDHQQIYRTIQDILAVQSMLDSVVLRDSCKSNGTLKIIGGVDYLVQLMESVPSAAGAKYYAKIVKDKSLLRSVIATAHKITESAYGPVENTDDFLQETASEFHELAVEGIQEERTCYVKDRSEEVGKAIIERRHGDTIGLATGFRDYDEIFSGFCAGDMVVLAGRSSMGKSALAMNIVTNLAFAGYPSLVFSLEMSAASLLERMIVGHAEVDASAARRGYLNQAEKESISGSAYLLSETGIVIDDTAALSMTQIEARAQKIIRRHPVKLIVIDYLQLIRGLGKGTYERVSNISTDIKSLARKLQLPVLVLSQLNRGVDGRDSQIPRISDLRDSGKIEEDADVVMLIYRKDYYQRFKKDYLPTNTADIFLAKQRNDPIGKCSLVWNASHVRFYDLHKEI